MRVVVGLKRDKSTKKEEFLCVECNQEICAETIQRNFCDTFSVENSEVRVSKDSKTYLYHMEAHYV